ncbi:MAG: competence/damage-inducible protein A, partial [Burkholderiales bacterium]|nr:competence/damage-inducible protein A [Burkholderiales bacterium]
HGRHVELGVKGPTALIPAAWRELYQILHQYGANMGPEMVRNI